MFVKGRFQFALIAAFASCCSISLAQPGPDLSCQDCPEFLSPPYPETGIGGNPDQSGLGFMLEVQDGRIAGFYFGYDETGAATWYVVTGELETLESPARGWGLTASLEAFSDGPCIDCLWQPFEVNESAGEVEFVFEQRGYGRYRIDEGDWQNIQPLLFGVDLAPLLEEQTPYQFPALEGYWAITIERDQEFVSRAVRIGNLMPEGENADSISTRIHKAEKLSAVPSPAPMIVGQLYCGPQPDAGSPLCVVELDEFAMNFRMPVANLADSYFRAETDQGHVLEAHRLNYD